jgi:aminobenzoyl-glutamate utilization protein B
MDNRNDLWRHVDASKERFIELSDRVWAIPEVCYTEKRSVAEHVAELRHQGFRITENVADIPTAVIGEAGEGGPVIAFLGEYDALPGLSQESGVARHSEIEAGGHGHGCGHNLLGSAALLAATAMKNWLAENKLPGRVRYYGCPAEEGGAAKAFMVRAGAFKDADIAISWHPSSFWEVTPPLSLANTRADFIFTGRASHAAASPELGRSALDAVELMSVGVNYMREHMPSDARVHYALLDTGGIAPNVVQAHARVRYSIRARRPAGNAGAGRPGQEDRRGRGADDRDDDGDEDRLRRLQRRRQRPRWSRRCRASWRISARRISTMPTRSSPARSARPCRRRTSTPSGARSGVPKTEAELADFTVPLDSPRNPAIGSTDVGDVSWVVPTVQAHAPTVAIGTPFHTWQVVGAGQDAGSAQGDGPGRQGDGRDRRRRADRPPADGGRQGRFPEAGRGRWRLYLAGPPRGAAAADHVDRRLKSLRT